MKLAVQIILLVSILFLAFLSYRTWQSTHSPEQAEFLTGKPPSITPEGFYKGSTTFYRANWQGKTFNSDKNAGDNSFSDGDQPRHKYPFKTYQGAGFKDPSLTTFKIDYQLPENQFYVRPILDEVVEVAPGKFLGKIHYRLIPGFPFTIGYFRLEK